MRRLRYSQLGTHELEQLESRRLLTAVTYTIDPARSSITLDTATSYFNGSSRFEPQRTNPSSIVAAISGSLTADLTGSTLTFQPTSLITVGQSPASPPAFTPAASAPGAENFGLRDVNTHGNFVNAAVRNASVVPSGVATFGGSVNGLQFSAATGWADYSLNTGFFLINGTRAFDATAVPNQSTDALLETNVGGVETITIPYRFDQNFTITTPNDTRVAVSGVVVATRSVGGPPATVVGRQLFYNQSSFDGNNISVNTTGATNDDTAIATDKTAYLPGQGAMTMTGATFPNNPQSFRHVSGFTRGINGLMVDITGLHPNISVSDFTFKVGNNNTPSLWANASAPTSVTVRTSGVGLASGNTRVEIIWPNTSIRNTWLEVMVKANANTGLADSAALPTNDGYGDVFFFGSRAGDSGSGDPQSFITTATDEINARNNSGIGVSVTNRFDYNKDGLVSATDQISSRNNAGFISFLNIASPPGAPPADATHALNAFAAALAALGAPITVSAATSAPSQSPSATAENATYRAASEQVFAALAATDTVACSPTAVTSVLNNDDLLEADFSGVSQWEWRARLSE